VKKVAEDYRVSCATTGATAGMLKELEKDKTISRTTSPRADKVEL